LKTSLEEDRINNFKLNLKPNEEIEHIEETLHDHSFSNVDFSVTPSKDELARDIIQEEAKENPILTLKRISSEYETGEMSDISAGEFDINTKSSILSSSSYACDTPLSVKIEFSESFDGPQENTNNFNYYFENFKKSQKKIK